MEDLLVELRNQRVNIRLAGERLDIEAPNGSLTPQLHAAITEHHDQLIALLKGSPQPRNLPRIKPQTQLRHDPFPLADIQQAYLIGRHKGLELGGVSSHFYLEFDGPGLDMPRLAAALRKVIDRHDMLRAVVETDGEQRILDHVPPYRIAATDLRGESPAAQSAAIEQVRSELGDQVLPTDQWPLFDIRATLLDEDRVRLHLSLDLLFVDVRSLLLMLNEWRRYYDDPTWSPAPLELSFRDYVLAEQGLQADPLGTGAADYWRSRLDELSPGPDLPLAVAPERLGPPTFVRRRAVISKERWAALTAVAGRRGLTPSVLLLASYCEVLRAWSKRQDFTVTLTLLNRLPLHPQVDQIMGDFLSPNLLAVAGRADETFEERAAGVQRQLLGDLAHSTFSGIRVLRELTRRQGDGRSVSMPVVFSSTLGAAAGDTKGDALSAFGDLVHGASQTPQVWLENQIFEEDGKLTLNWNAVDELFPPDMLDAMFDAYRTLLDRLVDDAAVWDQTGGVVPLPLAQSDERQLANATAMDLPAARLHELVAEAARRRPDAVAVIADGVEFTYRELSEDAHRLARRLRDCCDAEPNAIIAVSMRPGAGQIAALLGVLHAGAAYVSIDPELPEQRRQNLLRQCQAKAVVTETDLRDQLTWLPGVEVVTLDEDATRRCSPDPLESRQNYEDLAYVIFTSGSTGEPKGVMISHRSACNTIQDINQRFGVDENDRVLALAPTGFDLSVYDIFGVLGAGGAVVIPSAGRSNDVDHWSDLVDRYGVTIWNSVPAPLRMWIESLGEADSPRDGRLRLALLSGDWIPVDLPDQVREHCPAMKVISLGGATEGSIWSVSYPIGDVPPEWSSIPYGKPLANQTLQVYNEWLDPCPIGVTGGIYIGGVGVALGYWGDPVRTAERFIVHPGSGERLYKTGDLGRYLPGGDIEILGREDFQVKINGYRVELGEIEACLSRQPGVRQALVTAPAHPGTGQRQLTAYLVADDPNAATGADALEPPILRGALEGSLPSYMLPSHYVVLESLPLTSNGKIDRAALPTPWNDGDETNRRVAPSNEIEERLLALWSDLLGHSDFGIEDGFFDVGGDSLHAVRIIGQLRSEFGIDSAAEQEVIEGLFMNATIATFSGIILSIKEPGA
ncbi:non-ribosomal peptide synthetase [Streptomyces sp. H27-D2]|uniref:non-ribosomal peptide synthetase n=1 Tax=Streptomyces sp. H27-D2 TaxID=3046304 RepID=UPI002DB6BA17|nr:amino acid adenylation domain-containing protein [Streptomyces sp. H27-D2]MEC4020204.1 amino acid adenylation domain-containing protein [Streptomyces sp. H27-D2]